MILTKCPYCGKEISYLSLLKEESHGEHFCNSCKKESKICIQKRALIGFILTVVLTVIITALFVIFSLVNSFWTMIFVIAPFLAFYFISPIFVDFRPYRKYKEWMTSHNDVINDTENEE